MWVWTLSTSAMLKVSEMMIAGVWSNEDWFLKVDSSKKPIVNPLNIPKECVNEIIRLVQVQYYPNFPPELALRPLLMTGIEELNLFFSKNLRSSTTNLNNALRRLIKYADKITSIHLERFEGHICADPENYICSDDNFDGSENEEKSRKSEKPPEFDLKVWDAIGELLNHTKNLETLICPLMFDLSAIRNNLKLKKINVVFPNAQNPYYLPLLKYPEWGNLSFIIKHLPELQTWNDGDVYNAIKEMYGHEVKKSRPIKQYKFTHVFPGGLSEDTLEILMKTCPDLKSIKLSVMRPTYDTMLTQNAILNNYFIHLDLSGLRLNVFRLSHMFGPKITGLELDGKFITKIALVSICAKCPNLKELKLYQLNLRRDWITFMLDDRDLRKFAEILTRLQTFSLMGGTSTDKEYCDDIIKEFCLYILGNSFRLENLFLSDFMIHDGIMKRVLRRNPFSRLKYARFSSCFLTREGYSEMLGTARGLKLLTYDSPNADMAERLIIQCVNPMTFVEVLLLSDSFEDYN